MSEEGHPPDQPEGEPTVEPTKPIDHSDGPTHPGIEGIEHIEHSGPPAFGAGAPPPMDIPMAEASPHEAPSAEPPISENPFAVPSSDLHSTQDSTPASLIGEPVKPHWKEQLRNLAQKVKQSEWIQGLGAKIQNFEPTQAAEWASKGLQRQNAGPYGKAATIALCAFFLADLLALVIGKYIPEPPVSRLSRSANNSRRPKTIEDYGIIFSRNLFSSQNIIPGESTGSPSAPENNSAPVRTSLPFNLIGTVILQDELRSIATIEDKSASAVYPVRQTDEIPSKAKITKIEPRKVTFMNISSGRMEFVDMPDDGLPPQAARVSVSAPKAGGGIEKVSPNQYNVQRSEVDKALADLNKVLTEARAVPNFENGVANGYKLFQIVPNSIYDKLGLQNGDVITGLNGAAINDPGKAFEMLSELKTSNHLELQVKKDGKVQNNVYDIR